MTSLKRHPSRDVDETAATARRCVTVIRSAGHFSHCLKHRRRDTSLYRPAWPQHSILRKNNKNIKYKNKKGKKKKVFSDLPLSLFESPAKLFEDGVVVVVVPVVVVVGDDGEGTLH